MKNKTLITMMTAFALSAAIMPINATGTNAQSDNLEVSYSQPETFTLSIPSESVSLSTTENRTATFGVSDVNLAPNRQIDVSLTGLSNGKVDLSRKDDPDTKVVSTITVDNTTIVQDGIVANFEKDDKKNITFSAIRGENDEAVKAGTYSTILTFTASIVDSSN